MKTKNILPSDLGRSRPKTIDNLSNMGVRTLPRTPPGEGSRDQNKKQPLIQLGAADGINNERLTLLTQISKLGSN